MTYLFNSAKRLKSLSERQSFNGFHFLYVFVYKYFLDTSFIFISCTLLGDNYVSKPFHNYSIAMAKTFLSFDISNIGCEKLRNCFCLDLFTGVSIPGHGAVF